MTQPPPLPDRRRGPAPPSPGRPLYFVHVPKAAGTSVRQFLAMRVPEGAVRWLRHEDPAAHAENRTGLDGFSVVGGHEVYHLRDHLPPAAAVVTILREPVERALSAYHYFRAQGRETLRAAGGAPGLERVCDLAPGEFLDAEPLAGRRHLGNVQTWMFSRREMYLFARDLDLAPSDLDAAKRHLAACAAVGLAERLDDSLRLFCRTFGWPEPDAAPWVNRTPKRGGVADLDPETVRRLRELTSLDAQLYRFGVELFERQRRAARPTPGEGEAAPAEVAFTFGQGIPGYGWYAREASGHGTFCWSEREAWLEFPLADRGEASVCVHVLTALRPDQVEGLEVYLNGHRLPTTVGDDPPGRVVRGSVWLPPTEALAGRVRLRLRVPEALRPCDLIPGSTDARPLGIAVRGVRIAFAEPLSATLPAARVA